MKLGPQDARPANTDRLYALDKFRIGEIGIGINLMGISYSPKQFEVFGSITRSDEWSYSGRESHARFLYDMEHDAATLEKIGL